METLFKLDGNLNVQVQDDTFGLNGDITVTDQDQDYALVGNVTIASNDIPKALTLAVKATVSKKLPLKSILRDLKALLLPVEAKKAPAADSVLSQTIDMVSLLELLPMEAVLKNEAAYMALNEENRKKCQSMLQFELREAFKAILEDNVIESDEITRRLDAAKNKVLDIVRQMLAEQQAQQDVS